MAGGGPGARLLPWPGLRRCPGLARTPGRCGLRSRVHPWAAPSAPGPGCPRGPCGCVRRRAVPGGPRPGIYMRPGWAICLSNGARPEVRRLRPDRRRRPAQCPGSGGRGGRGGGGASQGVCFPILPRTPRGFSTSPLILRSPCTYLHTPIRSSCEGWWWVGFIWLRRSSHLRKVWPAPTSCLCCVVWKVKVMPQRGCLIQRTCKLPQKVISK